MKKNTIISFAALTALMCIFMLFVGAYNANGQTITMADVRAEYGDLPKLEKNVAPTLWGVAQGAGECASYLICTLQKRDGQGNLFKATYLVGYDANDDQILEILVTDFILSADGRQASVMQNGFRIDLSNRLN